MKNGAEFIARVTHAANREYRVLIGEDPGPVWDDADEDTRDGVIAGVQHYIATPGATPEDMHANWCEDKIRAGWTYGEEKDPEAKTHPQLRNYEDLPIEQRMKDRLFVGIVDALTGR